MALKRLVIDGYGQLELNQVAFRRDGRIEAQCKIADGIDFVENGMLLAIDPIAHTVDYPDSDSAYVALNYTTEHMYDERTPGLKNFKLDAGTFLPRLGYLATGDKFTTNCIAYDDDEFDDDDDVKDAVEACATTPVYGAPCANGAIKLSTNDADAVVQVVAGTTMPDGQYAVKFIAL